MSVGYQNLQINQGEDFITSITLDDYNGVPYNLTEFTVISIAKTSYYTSNASLVFSASILDASNGVIQLSANWTVTSNVSARQKLVYDTVIISPTGQRTRVLEGQIIISPAVSF